MDEMAKFGFGFMRLPEIEGADGEMHIDIDQAKEMVDIFMDAGFTYFDTARRYHFGKSEAALKEALVDRYPRDSFQLASKLPAWVAKGPDEARAMFDASLDQTGAGYFDFFLMHNLGEYRTKAFDEYGIWDFLFQKKEDGLIRKLGLSFHDNAAALEAVLDSHRPLDFVQLQINFADWENSLIESRKCYEVARARNLPVVIMEPLKGGSLVHLPAAAVEVLREANPRGAARILGSALRCVAARRAHRAVLACPQPTKLRENTRIMTSLGPLNEQERVALEQARAILASVPTVPCTSCGYCVEGCPEGVRIPSALYALNIMTLFEDMPMASHEYDWRTVGGRASSCIECGACELACPQHIEVMKELARAAELFE